MIHTLKLKTIALRWRDIILASTAIRDFCVEKYGKPPTLFVGVNGKRLPDKKHCPAIFIIPGVKTEGLDQPENSYGIAISWAILQPNVMVDGVTVPWTENITGEVIEFLGAYESDDFGQLIYETLQTVAMDEHPISKVDYEVDGSSEFCPQWPGHMILQTDIEPTLGETLTY